MAAPTGTSPPASLATLLLAAAIAFAAVSTSGAALAPDTATEPLDGPGDGPFAAAAMDQHDDDLYAVSQGDECFTVQPLGHGHRTAAEFYDYRHPDTVPSSYSYSSHGTTQYQADDTSVLFLFEGRDGLSLVTIHDQYDGDTAGGSATFQFTGLPADGEWTVLDDDYAGHDNEYDIRETSSRLTWVWTEGRTDGAVFTGLDNDFTVEVIPAFNEEADYRYTQEGYDGNVTDWEVISGPDHDRERTSLDQRLPMEISSGGCAAVTDLTVDGPAEANASTTVEATVANNGDREETLAVTFAVDGEPVDERTVTVGPGEEETVSTTLAFDGEGGYTVSANEASKTIDVVAEGGDGLPGFGAAAALAAILLALAAGRYRT